MRRFIIHLLVALFTFIVGTTADALIRDLLQLFNEEAEIETVSLPSGSATTLPFPVERETELSPCCCRYQNFPQRQATTSRPLISLAVLNARALRLPRPIYPSLARASHLSWKVLVQVVVDEAGCVINAQAVSGHPLLRAASVQAAYGACFSPSTLSGKPVSFKGVITYNFIFSES
jgi:TonB family protein